MQGCEFSDDENGQALQNMQELGDDLSRPRHIYFSMLFNSNEGALHFLDIAGKLEISARIEEDSPDPTSIDVTVKYYMVPTYQSIRDVEKNLERLARPFGGENDGWGCFSQ